MGKHFKKYGIGIKIVETGEIFETMTECAEYLGVTVGSVSMCLSGKTKSCRGYHLEMIETEFIHRLTEDVLDELYSITGVDCEWREHPYRDNVYVSDTGMIAKYQHRRVVLKRQHQQNSGYLTVSVADLGTKEHGDNNALVHRLVAETYVYNNDPDVKKYVNHIDGNKLNNCVDNLEWCTRSQNMRHAFDTGLYKTQRVMIVETGDIYMSSTKCANAIGGTVSGIHDCKTGRQKQHRGYHFKFIGDDDIE